MKNQLAECGSKATVISDSELEAQVLGLVQNAVILRPADSAEWIAGSIPSENQGEWCLGEFSARLLDRYLIRAVRAERRKLRPKPTQIVLFRELANLPRRILTAEGKRPLLANATISQVRWYVKLLNQRHYERTQDLGQVVKLMEKYVGPTRGLTVLEVARMEASE